jgi:hypothetical protein
MTTRQRKPPLVLDVGIFHFSYGGNGGIASEHPDLREWEVQTVLKMKADPRVGRVQSKTIADTPITMSRNRAVRTAQEDGLHLCLMVDSDQSPKRHVGDSWYKPFWDVAFDEVYDHYQAGPLIIGAPYCGPPPFENVYVFQFENNMVGLGDETVVRLEQYTRSQAALMSGVGHVAALPTGMILFDMRVFDIAQPSGKSRRQVLEELVEGKLTLTQAEHELTQGWFYYEWSDGYASEKASTEDVASTRDIGLAVAAKLGYNPLRCAWDSWIGHHKPWNCGKPSYYSVENVSEHFRSVVQRNVSHRDRIVEFHSDVLEKASSNGRHG